MASAIAQVETSEREWRGFYPLSGIALSDIDKLPLGATTIRIMTEQCIDPWLKEMETTLSQDEYLSEDDRDTWRQNYQDMIGSYRRGQITVDSTSPERERAQVYAEVRAIGDLEKAR